MNIVSKVWLQMNFLFDPVQEFFNGNFWKVFSKRYSDVNGKVLVDLASGTGELRKHISPKKYLGVDINPSYVSFSRERFKESNTKFILGDITKTKLPPSDVIFLISAIHHLSDNQVTSLCKNLQKQKFKKFIVIDGIPKGPLSQILKWLDDKLGGGKYFRDENQIGNLLEKYFIVKKKGNFSAKDSFYFYPFVEASARLHRQKVH